MPEYRAPLQDIRFLLNDVFDIETLWQSLPGLDEVDMETANAILDEAAKLCEQALAPLNREADEAGCVWSNGHVSSPHGFKQAYTTFCEGGWGGLGGNPEYGGMGMPKTLVAAVEEMVQGSCMSFGLAPMLTAGACLAINAHARDELKMQYLPKMYSGEWAGAMDLTEPHCGTDLGLIKTKAVPSGDGSYNLSGTKIFITWGEHDMAENIVHLVLAKLPDAPAGSRGISLFLVPKMLSDEQGNLTQKNTVSCGSLEKKMGIKGSATCVMNFDDAKGWLVGEPNKGLACMFTMMNYERLVVGIQGVGVAEASYQNAVAYAKERVQGRSASGVQSPDQDADALLAHGDVRRMLLTMKSLNEGSRAFYVYVAQFLDIAKFTDDTERKQHADQCVSLYTPIAKAFMTDLAFEAAVHGQQVFGGHGYVREWGQEQHVRDARITQIYEGTNGIQAMDLIGRKTLACGGALAQLFTADVDTFIGEKRECEHAEIYIAGLNTAIEDFKKVTDFIVSDDSAEAAGTYATDYLALFGYTAYAYMWARMVVAVLESGREGVFEKSKLATAHFYFDKVLPRTKALKATILTGQEGLQAMQQDWF